jgi:hypothetical protein
MLGKKVNEVTYRARGSTAVKRDVGEEGNRENV